MTTQTPTIDHSTDLTIAAVGVARESVIAKREAAMAKVGELIAFEDDLTVHRIALQVLAARPQATAVEVAIDDDGFGFIRAREIVGLDEDTDALYQDLQDTVDNELFMHSSLAHRAQRAEGGTVTGHGYTVTWDSDDQELTGTIDLAAAAAVPQAPALLMSRALAEFIG